MKKNLLMNLFNAVGDFESHLQVLRDYPNTVQGDSNGEGGDDRSDLEREMSPLLDQLWHLCRKHPDYFEPTHKTHPHIIDEKGDIIPFDSDSLREKRISSYRDSIEAFCKEQKVSKTAFAKAYGCGKAYLSRILSGEKAANHDKFVVAFYNLGYQPAADGEWNWTFEKINQFL